MIKQKLPSTSAHWRQRLHEIIFEADTFEGKLFDVMLLLNVTLSVLVVMLESIARFQAQYGPTLIRIEWFFTLLFTVEYVLRIISVRRPWSYVFSFYGLVDLLSILPTYLTIIFPSGHYFMVIRVLRLLRLFRVLKLGLYLEEADRLFVALAASRRKIVVFLLTVLSVVIIVGAFIYVIEGEENGFTDIPTSIYWAIVTLTTVGYGDIAPQTAAGKLLAAMLMLLGYGIIAVPTGIVTAELVRGAVGPVSTQACPNCGREGHESDAIHCKYCGDILNQPPS